MSGCWIEMQLAESIIPGKLTIVVVAGAKHKSSIDQLWSKRHDLRIGMSVCHMPIAVIHIHEHSLSSTIVSGIQLTGLTGGH